MEQIWIFIIGAIIGAGIYGFLPRGKKPYSSDGKSKLIEKQAQEKATHLERIKELILEKDKITNDDIQKLLGVSDSTVQRYLNQLEEQGKIKQFGQTGQVYYTKN